MLFDIEYVMETALFRRGKPTELATDRISKHVIDAKSGRMVTIDRVTNEARLDGIVKSAPGLDRLHQLLGGGTVLLAQSLQESLVFVDGFLGSGERHTAIEQDISNKAANTVARGMASFILGNVYDAEYPLVFFLLDIVRF